MGHEWRDHPSLQGRFHADHPDDLQVIIHEGGPRIADRQPELVWVRTKACEGDIFTGTVLNQPHHLETVSLGDEICFVVPKGGLGPLRVTQKYLRERSDWIIHPCQQCGLSELFDAPSDLMKVVFPNVPDDAVMEMFTSLCGACGGIQLIQHKGVVLDDYSVEDSPQESG